MRTFIIGDVHGCLDELIALVRKLDPEPGDQLVQVGDLVAKGPDSQGVVAWAREHAMVAVMGNHDQRLVQFKEEGKELRPEHAKVAKTLKPADWAYLQALPFWRDFPQPSGLVRVVHAGVAPGVPLVKMRKRDLVTMRSITAAGEISDTISDGVPWASRWPGPEHIVFGHDAVRGLQQYEKATGLDTGCVYGGALTALVLPELRLVSVRAKRAYSVPSQRG